MRTPAPGVAPAVAAVVVASAGPTLSLLALFLGVGFVAGWAAGDLTTAITAAGAGAVTCWASMITHESAHLLVLRGPRRRRGLGSVASSATQVWSIATGLSPLTAASVALSGPLAGAATCLALATLGLPSWICVGVAGVHLVNLAPFAGDGELVWRGLAWAALRRWPTPAAAAAGPGASPPRPSGEPQNPSLRS